MYRLFALLFFLCMGGSSIHAQTAVGNLRAENFLKEFSSPANALQARQNINATNNAGRSFTTDYGAAQGGTNTTALNNAIANRVANGGGVVRIPGGYLGTFTYSLPDPSVVVWSDGPNANRSQFGFSSAATDSGVALGGLMATTRPSANNRAVFSVFGTSQGSGGNGANNGDFDSSFQEQKLNWNCTTARQAAAQCTTVALQGEDDTLFLSLFQGGPDATSSASLKSAGGLMTGTATCVGGIGFCLQSELKTIIEDPTTLAITQDIDIQMGGIDTRTGELSSNGAVFNTDTGVEGSALLIQNSNTGSWTDAMLVNNSGAATFDILPTGQIDWYASNTPQFGLVDVGGVWQISHLSNEIFGITTAGGVQLDSTSWATATAYLYGNIVTNAGNWYRCTSVGGTSTTAPTQSSGNFTDGTIVWAFGGAGNPPAFTPLLSGVAVQGLILNSVQGTPVQVPIQAGAGAPTAIVPGGTGSLYLRTDGGVTRSLYVNETGANTGWDPVLTRSLATATATGTNQATAFTLATRQTVFTTVAAGTGAILSNNIQEEIIVSAGANPLLLYPPVGSTINSDGTNTALSVPVGDIATCYFATTTQEYCTLNTLP